MLSVACRVVHQVVFSNSEFNIFNMRAFLKSHSAYARIPNAYPAILKSSNQCLMVQGNM